MLELFPKIEICKYGYDENLEYVVLDNTIAIDGSNITIVILSMERIEHTMLLLKSFYEKVPNFKGQILIADNGSSKKSLSILYDFLKNYSFPVRLLEFENNFGLAKGRNKAFQEVKTEWIFSLDNDIFFLRNPFPEFAHTQRITRANFINGCLMDKDGKNYVCNGGHLWLNTQRDNRFSINSGPMCLLERGKENTEQEPFFSTFLAGGVAIIKKETFFECGGFDENFLVGFEDVDFSITLLDKGYKVANCGYAAMCHNHPQDSESQKTYDKVRYKYESIVKSAQYFENKHKLSVWDETTKKFFEDKRKRINEKRLEREEQSIEEKFELQLEQYHQAEKIFKETSSHVNKTYFLRQKEASEYVKNLEKENVELRTMNNELRIMDAQLREEKKQLKMQYIELEDYNKRLKQLRKSLLGMLCDQKNETREEKNL